MNTQFSLELIDFSWFLDVENPFIEPTFSTAFHRLGFYRVLPGFVVVVEANQTAHSVSLKFKGVFFLSLSLYLYETLAGGDFHFLGPSNWMKLLRTFFKKFFFALAVQLLPVWFLLSFFFNSFFFFVWFLLTFFSDLFRRRRWYDTTRRQVLVSHLLCGPVSFFLSSFLPFLSFLFF